MPGGFVIIIITIIIIVIIVNLMNIIVNNSNEYLTAATAQLHHHCTALPLPDTALLTSFRENTNVSEAASLNAKARMRAGPVLSAGVVCDH